jgi:hypothetical protein
LVIVADANKSPKSRHCDGEVPRKMGGADGRVGIGSDLRQSEQFVKQTLSPFLSIYGLEELNRYEGNARPRHAAYVVASGKEV